MRKKIMLSFIIFALIFFPSYTYAQNSTEKVKDKLILQFIDPFFGTALENHFGTLYNISTMCEKLVDVKQDPNRPRVFTITAKTQTFQGAHNPPNYAVYIEVSNKEDRNTFKLIKYKVELTNKSCKDY